MGEPSKPLPARLMLMLLMLLPFYMVLVRDLMQKEADHFSSSDVFSENLVRSSLPNSAPVATCFLCCFFYALCFFLSHLCRTVLLGNCQHQLLNVDVLVL